jgi:Chromo (CHRromatin Organisation MOdifier) domain
VFHASLLSPYRETDAHSPNFPRPAPDLLDGDEHFKVESILDSHFYRRSLQYLVHWKGYPSSDDQWLPAPELHQESGKTADVLTSALSATSGAFIQRSLAFIDIQLSVRQNIEDFS